jgi:hypothetical protein
MPNVDRYNPEALTQCLTVLSDAAQAARDAFMMGDDAEGHKALNTAVSALAMATRQLYLKNREISLS